MESPAMHGRYRRLLAGLCLAVHFAAAAHASDLCCLNATIRGSVVDCTRRGATDRRFWSESLSMPRDMFVYLPPDYDPERAYPLLLWIHGFGGDEGQFTRQVVAALDSAISSGAMPPVIAAC